METTHTTQSATDRALDLFAQMMIEKIESISQDWKKPWFTEGCTSWPRNLSGREYNGMNAFMLTMLCEQRGYKHPIFCTFDRAVGLSYTKGKDGKMEKVKDKDGNELPKVSINKGEKSFPVFLTTFTVVHKDTKDKIPYDDYKAMSEEQRKNYNTYPSSKVYNVFNIDQTNLAEARPELYEKIIGTTAQVKPMTMNGEEYTFPAMDDIVSQNKWICPINIEYGNDAYYSISKNVIVVPEKKQFKDGESFYSNLFHEMAHSTGAKGLLDRLKPTSFGSAEYAKEELVAEMTAALVSVRYGIEKNIKEDSAAYLKCWLKSLKEKPSFIKEVLGDVKKASSVITKCIDAEVGYDTTTCVVEVPESHKMSYKMEKKPRRVTRKRKVTAK